jgi:dolichyl-phosphate-mannose-protein mannosyltransferase
MITIKKLLKPKLSIVLILVLTFALRLVNINYPNNYVFDEVYHAFTAKEYLKGSKEAWEWWNTPPPGVAYEWTHPPLAKEIMTGSMHLLKTTDAWAWRLPGIIFGTLAVFIIYLLGKELFKNEAASLLSAFFFSLDGLNFVQSRTGMNDIYFVTFVLTSLLFFLKKQYLFSSILFGLALSSKWAAVYLLGVYLVLLIRERKQFFKLSYFIFIPILVYFLSYLPFFMQGHSMQQFFNKNLLFSCNSQFQNCDYGLQQQMWTYHTRLKATHDYSSDWWSWPLNLYPVWYFVQYHQDGKSSNIFATGNPVFFWLGSGSIVLTLFYYLKHLLSIKSRNMFKISTLLWENFLNPKYDKYLVILLGYFAFLLPWALSPRIMFLYHYSPCIPFMALALGYQISTASLRVSSSIEQSRNERLFLYTILGLVIISFIASYPFLVGIPLPNNLREMFFNFNLTKNPFL